MDLRPDFRVVDFRLVFRPVDFREEDLRALVRAADLRVVLFLELLFLEVLFDARLRGTFSPFSRASLIPIAIACFRLVTLRPPRVLSVPLARRRAALATVALAFLPYFLPEDFLRAPPLDFRAAI